MEVSALSPLGSAGLLLGGRWVLLIVRGSTTTLPFSAFSDYVTFSSRVEMPALVVGLSS